MKQDDVVDPKIQAKERSKILLREKAKIHNMTLLIAGKVNAKV
ncbi:MAG: hypothetical protein OCC45_08780 [Desulfotalea sp.]